MPSGRAALLPQNDLGLKLPAGFKATSYADERLANDIYSMTLDSAGNVVVTGPGYIRRLEDTKHAGKADKATLFGTTVTGGMGMCFDGNDLFFFGDGQFSVYRDANGDGVADGPPEKITPLGFAEHGAHAMRKGPDGWWYLIGGNDSGFSPQNAPGDQSPVRQPEAGCLLRFSPDFNLSEIIAHGFRNPYDFDFNAAGDIFTYDSDVESDYFLPWYAPTRIYHVAYGGHHGWQLNGWQRSWNRPDYYPDAVSILAPIGRGSPTGVICYRHHQFPEHYRNGLFVLDWTFGRIWFLPLRPAGGTYQPAPPEVFLEPIGTHGFAPTDVAVAPDGSLFVSIGGRKTRGSVYRIEYAGPKTYQPPLQETALSQVLNAPQPLDAWSRAIWIPQAKKLGAQVFVGAARNPAGAPEQRTRAIEILTELFGGLPAPLAKELATSPSAPVRARTAWSLGRVPNPGFDAPLLSLTSDPDPTARRRALEAIQDQFGKFDPKRLVAAVVDNLGNPDKRVRTVASTLAEHLPEPVWRTIWPPAPGLGPQARLFLALVSLHRSREATVRPELVAVATDILESSPGRDLRIGALRLAQLALGDWNLRRPSLEVYTAYELSAPINDESVVARLRNDVRSLFPSNDPVLDRETSRLLAMLQDNDLLLFFRLLSRFSAGSSATDDFHYLTVASRLTSPRDPNLYTTAEPPSRILAKTVLDLDRKLAGQERRSKQNWSLRLAEVTAQLLQKDARFGEELLGDPGFVRASHIALAASLPSPFHERAAQLFFEAAQRNAALPWSPSLISLLGDLPPNQVRPLFRTRWNNPGLRDDILLRLAQRPEVIDREKFFQGLTSPQSAVVQASVAALSALPRSGDPKILVPLLQAFRPMVTDTNRARLRQDTARLIYREAGQNFEIKETGSDPSTLQWNYQPVFDWFTKKYPALARTLPSAADEDPVAWLKRFRAIDWKQGNAGRGLAIFQSRCASCHGPDNAVGPDLTGVARRLSPEDLFLAIALPSRDIAPLYRPTVVRLADGQTVSGIIAFESADGLILQTGPNMTVRVDTGQIASREPGTMSLMPTGLLNDLKPLDWADLYQYVQTLTGR